MTVEEAFVKFTEIWNSADLGKTIEQVVKEEDLKVTPAAITDNTGCAYEGALLFHTIMVYFYANKLIKDYGKTYNVDPKSMAKVCVLYQLGKVGMMIPNDNEWEVNKLGKSFKFAETDSVLKTGELSHLICSNAGITFTREEREAMTICDKSGDEFEKMNKFISPLSKILRQANEMAFNVEMQRWKDSQK